VPAGCRLLLGPRYALLRPEFAEQRKSVGGRSGDVRRIVVCYGGSDPSNETAKALAAIKGLSAGSLEIDVVVGLSNPHGDSVAALCRELPRATLHRGADNMAQLMARADLAIGAGGVMCWERCCLGLPTVAVDIATNQVGALTALAAAGALVYLGSADSVDEGQMTRCLDALLRNPAQTRAIGEKASALVDGEGLDRVRAEMEAQGVS
jgi:UDP-2,4-diacetamido-2,4,6-trideoxy-beta-L-altropyranose hydrolase